MSSKQHGRSGSAGEGCLRLIISNLSGEEEDLQVRQTATLHEVKTLLAEKHGTSASMLKLIYDGAIILDHQTLESCGISDGSSLELVRSLLPPGFHEMSTEDRAALLWKAASSGDTAMAATLIDLAVPLNEPGLAAKGCVDSLRQGTPLWEASRHGHQDIAFALIAAKADLEKGGQLEYGFKWATQGSPALLAAQHGHVAILKGLLEARANIESFGSWNNDYKMDAMRGKFRGPSGCLLGIASIFGHSAGVKALVEAKADTEKCCIFQNQAVHGSESHAGEGQEDGDRLSGIGTALYAASALGDLETLKLLLDAKADADCLGLCKVGNDNDENLCAYAHPLLFDSRLTFRPVQHHARSMPCYSRIGERSESPESPLAVASRFGRTEIVEILLSASDRD